MTLRRIETTYYGRPGHKYVLDDKPVMGITTLLSKGVPKPALPNWAARTAAEFTADNLDVLAQLPDRESVIKVVAQSPWSERDRAAVRGTDIHALADKLIHGQPVDVPEDLQGPVDGYVRFLDAWKLKPRLTERPVASRKWWIAGTFDAIFELPSGETLLADWKTSKGVYGEAALQVAAYANCEFHLDNNGHEQPMPHVDGLVIVHITPTGTDLYRVNDPEAAWKDFLHAAWTAKAEQRIKQQIGDPSPAPGLQVVA